jgi:hypothetical protein
MSRDSEIWVLAAGEGLGPHWIENLEGITVQNYTLFPFVISFPIPVPRLWVEKVSRTTGDDWFCRLSISPPPSASQTMVQDAKTTDVT